MIFMVAISNELINIYVMMTEPTKKKLANLTSYHSNVGCLFLTMDF